MTRPKKNYGLIFFLVALFVLLLSLFFVFLFFFKTKDPLPATSIHRKLIEKLWLGPFSLFSKKGLSVLLQECGEENAIDLPDDFFKCNPLLLHCFIKKNFPKDFIHHHQNPSFYPKLILPQNSFFKNPQILVTEKIEAGFFNHFLPFRCAQTPLPQGPYGDGQSLDANWHNGGRPILIDTYPVFYSDVLPWILEKQKISSYLLQKKKFPLTGSLSYVASNLSFKEAQEFCGDLKKSLLSKEVFMAAFSFRDPLDAKTLSREEFLDSIYSKIIYFSTTPFSYNNSYAANKHYLSKCRFFYDKNCLQEKQSEPFVSFMTWTGLHLFYGGPLTWLDDLKKPALVLLPSFYFFAKEIFTLNAFGTLENNHLVLPDSFENILPSPSFFHTQFRCQEERMGSWP